MALLMHQDIDLVAPTEEELFPYLAGGLTEDERATVIHFVEELLAADLSGNQLADIWSDAGADWILPDKQAPLFFSYLLSELHKQ